MLYASRTDVACTVVSRQRLAKHVPAATATHATIEVQLETVFSTRAEQRGYNESTEAEEYFPVWRRDRIPPP
jgi:hypothetical protein